MLSDISMLIMRDTYSKYTGSQFSPDRSPQLHRVCFAKINRWEMRGHDHNRDNLTPKDVNILCLNELLLLRAETAHTDVGKVAMRLIWVWHHFPLRPVITRLVDGRCCLSVRGLFFPDWISLCNLYWTTGPWALHRTGLFQVNLLMPEIPDTPVRCWRSPDLAASHMR